MRIETVTAHAFGPLVEATLPLARGLTVVTGPNESGKSSWHAALFAALCGRRRGKGPAGCEDRRFAELHRPWDSGKWSASAVLVLDDGRRIEITHDLAGRVNCRATDLGLGRDVSQEILYDGNPDASRWLGLDRRSFPATASVRQAELLTVLTAADGLQTHLQRAAATAGTDATAAAAIEHIDQFSGTAIGTVRSPTKPLHRANRAVGDAEADVTRARAAHGDYLSLAATARALRRAADTASDRTAMAEKELTTLDELLGAARDAAEACVFWRGERDRAETLEENLRRERTRLERAVELDERFHGVEPPAAAAADELAQQVTVALARWRAAPEPAALPGPTARALAEQLADLPSPPVGDLAVHAEIRRAWDEHALAVRVAADRAGRRPSDLEAQAAAEVREAAVDDARNRRAAAAQALRRACEAYETEAAAFSRTLAIEQGAAGSTARRRTRKRGSGSAPLVLLGATLGVLGCTAVLAGMPVVGTGLVATGIVALVLAGSRRYTSSPDWMSSDVSAAAGAADEAAAAVQHARLADVAAAAELATAEGRIEGAARELAEWRADEDRHGAQVARTEHLLRAALAARNAVGAADLDVAVSDVVAAYEQACSARAVQHRGASRRRDLESALADRRAAEDSARAGAQTRDAAARAVFRALAAIISARDMPARAAGAAPADSSEARDLGESGLDGELDAQDLCVAAERLDAWLEQRTEWLATARADQAAWADRCSLLSGDTLDALAERVRALDASALTQQAVATEAHRDMDATFADRAAAAAAAEVDLDTAADVSAVGRLVEAARQRLAMARDIAAERLQHAERTEGMVLEREAALPDVAEAEERLAAALVERQRVTDLAETLALTRSFLVQAQERVHRDIAPTLAASLRRWLPSVTRGRYTDALVDPATLTVRVRAGGGVWRRADRLSVGTAEQVYLLLRVALAEHLTVAGETCPLILDDVTVQADRGRTEAILDMLHDLSDERQVVLFAQDPVVSAWAETALRGDRDGVVRLPVLQPA